MSINKNDDKTNTKTIFLNKIPNGPGTMQDVITYSKQRFPYLTKEAGKEITFEFPYVFNLLTNVASYTQFKGVQISQPSLQITISCKDLLNNFYRFNYIVNVFHINIRFFQYVEVDLIIENL